MRPFWGIAAAVSAFVLSGCLIVDWGPSDRFQNPFHYSYDLSPGGRLSVDNFNGAVEITGWDENKVEITGTKYASSQAVLDSLKIEIRNEPDFIDIRMVRPAEPFSNAGARFAIRVPRKAALDRIGTSNGEIRIHDVESGARLKTSNGAIRADNLRGAVDAQTTNGAIEMHAIDGSAVMKTSNGRIHAEEITGECEARTSNGSIDLSFLRAPKSDIRAETRNGSITVHLPADTSARLKADTSNSSISTELDVGGHVQGSGGKLDHLDGTIGAGGPLIELGTRNGHINLLRI